MNLLRDEIHTDAIARGWWTNERNIGELLALVHSEVSEALEEYREGRMETYEESATGKPCGFPSEIADTIIRLLDLCGGLEIDIDRELRRKIDFNKTRPYRHGGKLA